MSTETDIEELVEQKVQEEVEQRLEKHQKKASRRSFLASMAGVAGVGALGVYGGQRAAADPSQASGTVYFEQIGDSSHPVQDLYVQNQVNYNETEYFEQLSADDLDIGGADFVSTGDVLPVLSHIPHQQVESFSSSTYDSNPDFYLQRLTIGAYVPDGANIVARLQGTVLPGAGETVDIRWRNADASETVAEVTNLSSLTAFDSGWQLYNPGSPSATGSYVLERRTDPGSNSSDIRSMSMAIGIQL